MDKDKKQSAQDKREYRLKKYLHKNKTFLIGYVSEHFPERTEMRGYIMRMMFRHKKLLEEKIQYFTGAADGPE
jgi:hypothetical protein